MPKQQAFFERAAQDLKSYDQEIWLYGNAKPVYDSIQKAIASGDNQGLASAYLHAIFALNNLGEGSELKTLLIKTLEDIYQGKIEDLSYTLDSETLLKPTQLIEAVKSTLEKKFQQAFATQQEQIDVILKQTKELSSTFEDLGKMLNKFSGEIKQHEIELKRLTQAVSESTHMTKMTLFSTEKLTRTFQSLWERHSPTVITVGVIALVLALGIAYYTGRNKGRNERDQEFSLPKKEGNVPKANSRSRCSIL